MKTTGLTLKEAIESGIKLKRPLWRDYRLSSVFSYSVEDVYATDYELEVEEQKIELTASQIKNAWIRLSQTRDLIFPEMLTKELGFKDEP